MVKIKGWEKIIDNTGSKEFHTMLMAWSTPSEKIVQIWRPIGGSYYFVDVSKDDYYTDLLKTSSFEEARNAAISYMRSH